MKGRKPVPTTLRILRGNPRQHKINRREPRAKPVKSAPAWLNPSAKREWRRIAKEAPRGLITQIDRQILAQYCQNVARIAELERIVTEEGYTFLSEKGYVCQRPEMGILKGLQTLQIRICEQLGFTPSGRSRVTIVPPAQQEDPDEALLFGKKKA